MISIIALEVLDVWLESVIHSIRVFFLNSFPLYTIGFNHFNDTPDDCYACMHACIQIAMMLIVLASTSFTKGETLTTAIHAAPQPSPRNRHKTKLEESTYKSCEQWE
jgi:hypothetical protein